MPNSIAYREKANLMRRINRRVRSVSVSPDEETRQCPTYSEISEALVGVRTSPDGVLRLAALMDNVSAYHAPRLIEGDWSRARTNGVKVFLERDVFLMSFYHTLMRYARLGRAIRRACGIVDEANLLWGLEDICPKEAKDGLADDYSCIRAMFKSLAGLCFKDVECKVKGTL